MILTALDLASLLPGFLREDVSSRAVCRALEPLLSQIVTDLDLLNTYTSVDRQPDDVLDQLAVGWGYPGTTARIRLMQSEKSSAMRCGSSDALAQSPR